MSCGASSTEPLRARSQQVNLAALIKRIEFYEWSTGVYREKLRSLELTVQHRGSLMYNVFKDGLEQLIARYSAGESVLKMKESLPTVIAEFYSICSTGADVLALSSLDEYTLVLCKRLGLPS